MKKIRLSSSLFRMAAVLPLVLMFVALGFAYVGSPGQEGSDASAAMGILNANLSWRVHLKDNPFYPTKDLGSDYAYIKELVDYIQFNMKFSLEGAPENAGVTIGYQVDGTLRANYEALSNVLLLQQVYPKLNEGSVALSGPDFEGARQFDLPLANYSHVIDSFQSAYRIAVKSKLDLTILVKVSLKAAGAGIEKTVPISLTIPLDDSVFQISGSPTSKIELSEAQSGAAGAAVALGGPRLYFLAAAGGLLLLAAAVLVFFAPRRLDPWVAELKSVTQKCKGNLVRVDADPRKGYAVCLPVSDIAGILSIADLSGQPVLHLPKKDTHLFFVSADGILYAYELKPGARSAGPAESAPQSAPGLPR